MKGATRLLGLAIAILLLATLAFAGVAIVAGAILAFVAIFAGAWCIDTYRAWRTRRRIKRWLKERS